VFDRYHLIAIYTLDGFCNLVSIYAMGSRFDVVRNARCGLEHAGAR